jgi:hypothetical protein
MKSLKQLLKKSGSALKDEKHNSKAPILDVLGIVTSMRKCPLLQFAIGTYKGVFI